MRRFIDFSDRGVRAQSQRRVRRSRVVFLERLEQRLVLNATIVAFPQNSAPGTTVSLNWGGDTTADDVTLSFASGAYQYDDPGHTITVTADPSIVITNNNTSDVTVAAATSYSIGQVRFFDGTNVGPVSGNTYNFAPVISGSAPIDVIGPVAGTVADNVSLGNNASGLGAGFPAVTISDYTGTSAVALTINDAGGASGQTYTMTGNSVSEGANTIATYAGSNLSSLNLTTASAGSSTVNVTGTPTASPAPSVGIDASGTGNHVNLGNAADPASGLGNITLLGNSHLTVDDSGDSTARTYSISSADTKIGAAPTFNYSGESLDSLTVLGGTGGNTVNIASTPNGTSGSPITTTYEASASTVSGDSVNVTSTSDDGPLVIDFQGGAKGGVLLGAVTKLMAGIAGTVSIEDTTHQTVKFDDASNSSNATATLIESAGLSSFTGANAGAVTFDPATVSLVQYNSGGGTAEFIVDFSGGNPLPTSVTPGLSYFGLPGGSSTLVLQGELPGPTLWSSEDYTPASGSNGSGTITLTAGSTTTIDFSSLSPIDDTTPATNYTFTAPASASTIDLTNGPTLGNVVTDTISSNPSAFELVNFGNKTNVTVDVTAMTNPTVSNSITVPATGLESLQIVTNADNQTITITNTPAGVTTTFDLEGSGNTLNVLATTGPLVITATSAGPNTVNLGTNDSLSTINGAVTVNGDPGTTGAITLNLDDSANPNSESPIVEFDSTTTLGEVVGIAPATIEYQVSTLGLLAIDTGTSPANVLTVDFANGNPIPGNSGGLLYDGGSAASSTLDLQNGSFPNETYAPSGQAPER